MGACFILSVSNRKGGSGKSTTVVNLGAEWSARGARVLVVDLDTQGHSGLGLGLAPARDHPTAHDLFRDLAPSSVPSLVEAIRPTAWEGLDCACADPLFEASGPRDLDLLARALRDPAVASVYDVVLLDTPPSLDFLLMNALAAAHGVLVPLLPHSLSAEGVKQLSRLFLRIATSTNPRLKLVGLLPITIDQRTNHHRVVIDDLKQRYGAERVLRGIRKDIALAEAFAQGVPARRYAPRSRGALDYYLLAEDLAPLWDGSALSSHREPVA